MAEIKVAMISSTVRDLPGHREKVRDACLCQGVMPSMMEHWPALDADGIAASLEKVDDADIYLGVFAHRYGYVPEGKNCSITEMEYDRAVKRDIPRLIFLMDEDHPLKISQIEIAAAAKLQKLKERLKQERSVAFFKSEDDLSAKVIHSLSPYAISKTTVEQSSTPLTSAAGPEFDPRNYVFFVPYRQKGDQVVGRDSALQAVRAQLVGGRRTAIGQTASFQGLGGLGKTQLAVEYAYFFRDQYPNGVIWLNADQDIEAQLIKIAEKARWVASESEHKDKLAIAQQRLRTHSHCLVIFDNLEKPDTIRDYLPDPDAEPHVLVTSRIDQPDFVPVPLDLLDTELSVQLLTQEAGQSPLIEDEVKAVREISERLGGLPLALELAGAYLRHRSIGWVRYRDLLNQNLKAALPGKFLRASFTRHEADLYSTLKVNDDVLSEEPLLREILDVLTWSGASAMGQSLLCALLDVKDSSQTAGALSLGVALRLLQKTPGTESYALHRLVCEVRREDAPLAARQEWALRISERLADWFQALKRNFSDLPRFEAEIEHLHSWQVNVLEFAPKLASRLIWLQAYPPFHRGRYSDSCDWLQKASDLLEPVVDTDLELKANLLTDLSTIDTGLGNYTEARKCGEEAIRIRIKLFGERNSETAMSFHNTGGSLRGLRDNERALQHAKKALEIWTALHGENHIDTALALDALSGVYAALGDSKQALSFAERALSIREKVLGLQHPDTAQSFSNVGNIYAALNDFPRALQCEEKALSIAHKLLGTRSPLGATIQNNICLAYRGLREFKKALQAGLDSLAMRKEMFGDQHPDTLISVLNVATTHFDLGHVHSGFQLLDEYVKKTPKDHPQYELLKERRRDFQANISRPGFRQPPGKKRQS